MRDHITWRPNWFYSEYHELEDYERERRRHAIAAFLGGLTALLCAAGLVYLLTH